MSQPWFDPNQFGAWFGALGGGIGGIFGIFGGIVGYLMPKGKAKRFVFGGFAFFGLLGVLCLIAGVYALVVGQPFFIWYGPLLIGTIETFLTTFFYFMARKTYAQVEARKLEAASFRDS